MLRISKQVTGLDQNLKGRAFKKGRNNNIGI